MRSFLAAGGVLFAVLSTISVAQNNKTDKTPQTPAQSKSKVVFSRSDDSASQQATPSSPSKIAPIAVTDTERKAVTYTAYNLDIRLRPAEQSLAVRALVTVRNDGIAPIAHIPLQLSSTLRWESVHLQGKDIPYSVADVKSDVDHTGVLHEAAIPLAEPLAPGKELQLDVIYSGKIEASHQRFDSVRMPEDVASHSDWDRISSDFVGLRGFGNVIWYPVTSVPVYLGEGSKLFDMIGTEKLRQSSARFQAKVSLEYLGAAPNIAVINGKVVPITVPSGQATPDIPQIATFQFDEASLGFVAPSIFAAVREEHDSNLLHVYSRTEDSANAPAFATAGTMVAPLLKQWLGPSPRVPVTVIDLPEADDVAAEIGPVLFIPIEEVAPDKLTRGVAHLLAHAWFQSSRQWLDEGVAHFIDLLWTEQQQGRDKALAALQSSRAALALEEPGSPQDGPGQPLLTASSPVYFRDKAADVLWMLRDIAGDDPVAAALHAYRASEDTTPDYFEKLIEQHAKGKDLHWFFDDWVYRDRGLPDLSISAVYTDTAAAGSFIAAIDIANDGWAAAEVPVTVRSQKTSITERVHIPAHEKLLHRIVIQGKPVEVQVNDGTVPEVQASIHVHDVGSAAAPK